MKDIPFSEKRSKANQKVSEKSGLYLPPSTLHYKVALVDFLVQGMLWNYGNSYKETLLLGRVLSHFKSHAFSCDAVSAAPPRMTWIWYNHHNSCGFLVPAVVSLEHHVDIGLMGIPPVIFWEDFGKSTVAPFTAVLLGFLWNSLLARQKKKLSCTTAS